MHILKALTAVFQYPAWISKNTHISKVVSNIMTVLEGFRIKYREETGTFAVEQEVADIKSRIYFLVSYIWEACSIIDKDHEPEVSCAELLRVTAEFASETPTVQIQVHVGVVKAMVVLTTRDGREITSTKISAN